MYAYLKGLFVQKSPSRVVVDVNGVVYKSISGSLEVTKYDKTAQKISGTFTGTIKEENSTTQKTITEGKVNNVRVTPF